MQIRGSKVLLTGASGGLGGAIARELARRGADLVITARSRATLEDLAAEIGAEVEVADLSDRSDVDRLCGLLGDVDVLVANAGVGGEGGILGTPTEQIDFMVDVNLRAPMVMAGEFARRRVEANRSGQVVMVGSLSGVVATANTALYNGTKFGLRGFTLAIRQDLAPHGIGVSLVAPGFIDSAGMFAENGIELPKGVRTRSPGDVAAGVVKAIESNPAEVYVAPPELRLSAHVGGLAPALSEVIQRRMGVSEMTSEK